MNKLQLEDWQDILRRVTQLYFKNNKNAAKDAKF